MGNTKVRTKKVQKKITAKAKVKKAKKIVKVVEPEVATSMDDEVEEFNVFDENDEVAEFEEPDFDDLKED